MSPRFPFAIVIDGTTVLPQAMRRELDLRTLPLHVSFGAESYTAGYWTTSWSDLVVFSILIAFMIFRPQGLLGRADIRKV